MIISRFMDILLQVSKYSMQLDAGVYDSDCISVETDRCEGSITVHVVSMSIPHLFLPEQSLVLRPDTLGGGHAWPVRTLEVYLRDQYFTPNYRGDDSVVR